MQAQLVLPYLGPNEHFQALHGQHKDSVAFLTKCAGEEPEQKTLSHKRAAFRASTILQDGFDTSGIYMSINGFKGRRASNNASALTSLFIDFDNYNIPGLAHLDAAGLLSVILDKEKWLPTPTYLADSGRGSYFVWLLEKPLCKQSRPQWQVVEDYLVDKLKSYGADPAARDAARVLRLAGSTNQKNGETVFYRQLGDKVSFSQMRALVPKPTPRPTVTLPNKRKSPRTNVTTLRSRYTLASARMQDCDELARQRAIASGGLMTDYRHRMVYCFALAAAWYCHTPDNLLNDIKVFCQTWFAEPERYYKSSDVTTIISRMIAEKAGATAREQTRYTPKNEYLIEQLEITAEEQQSMITLIGPEEKRIRALAAKDKKRRKAGKPTRSALTAEYLLRVEKARQLAASGLSINQIVRELNISRRTVYNYLSAL